MIAALIAGNLASAPGQTKVSGARQAADDGTDARGLFITKKSDAMRIEVLDASSGAPVYPNQKFKQGDALKVAIQSNFEGYVYIINVERGERGRQERRFLLFPYAREATNKINPASRYELPRNGVIAFDETPGIEVLQVIMSRNPIGFLDAALKSVECSKDETRCKLSQSASARAAKVTGDRKASPAPTEGGVVGKTASPRQGSGSLRTRDIILSPGKDRDEKATYVAIPQSDGAEGRLKSGDVVVFQILLEHRNP